MALLAPVGSAHAGLLTQSAGKCPSYEMSKVFAKWLDPFHYTLAPGGSFESTAGLTMTGGAKVVAGNESSYVNGKTDKNSVLLPRGGTVMTGPICVGLDKPTVRFFAKRPSFALLPLLTVEGVYTTPVGAHRLAAARRRPARREQLVAAASLRLPGLGPRARRHHDDALPHPRGQRRLAGRRLLRRSRGAHGYGGI